MNRIQQITYHFGNPFISPASVTFKDDIDVDFLMLGKTFRFPTASTIERINKIAQSPDYKVTIDANNNRVIIERRDDE